MIKNQTAKESNTNKVMRVKEAILTQNLDQYYGAEKISLGKRKRVYPNMAQRSPKKLQKWGSGKKALPSHVVYNFTHANNSINNFCGEVQRQELKSGLPLLPLNVSNFLLFIIS